MNLSFPAILAFSLLLLSSCGYETSPKGITIGDETYERIAIPAFHNISYTPGAEVEVTKALRETVMNSGSMELASRDDANVILHGEVTSVGQSVLALNNVGSATEYRLSMAISFNVKSSTGQEYFKDTVSGTWDYKYTDNSIDNKIRQREAITNLSEELAREILLLVRERFNHNSRNH